MDAEEAPLPERAIERHYSPQRAGELLDVPEDTIRFWIREGKLRAVVLARGGRGRARVVRIPESAIADFLGAGR